ncbi:MAG: TRAP transporter fused permease subunit [Desulfatiglandaceae bacterium]
MRRLSGWKQTAAGLWLTVVSVFALYTATFGVMQPRIQRGVHILFLLPMAFIFFPASKRSTSNTVPAYDWLLAFLALLPPLYLMINNDSLSMRLQFIDPLTQTQMLLGALNIILLLEAIRRAVVPAMTILIGVFILYLYGAPYLPGVFYCKPLPLSELIEMQYLLTDTGMYGSITGISATFVALFVIFGSFMESTETGKFFTDLACRLAGKSRGGPAKVSVISSSFFGSISGVAAANVYATGTFTIPMMKKLGFRPQAAGAVEAVASSGGQYMPPIMGAGAFVMSEITGIPYLEICISAALPALIYYSSLVIRVHFIAVKENLKGMNEEDLSVPLSHILKDSYLLLPIAGLVTMLLIGYSVFMAAMGAITFSFVISMFKKRTALTPKRLFEALRSAGQNLIMIALACAGAGMVVAIVTHTGLALGIATVINNWSGGHLLPALMLIMVTSLVLGMGMPCTPAYIIAVTVGGPALVALGTDLLASHLLVFYFAILAEVTPPVCIPAYCAASIAHAKPLQTGFEAFKLAVVAFIVPYIFVYNPALLLKGNAAETISLVLVMLSAIVFLSAAVTAYFFKKLNTLERLAMGVAAAGGIILSAHREIVGHPATLAAVLSITIVFFTWVFLRSRKATG